MKEAQLNIQGNFDQQMPERIPMFVCGADAKVVYDCMLETFGQGVCYDEESRTMQGSNFPIAARLDSLLKEKNLGIRVATLADLLSPEVQRMIEGNYYSDTPSLILRTERDTYEINNPLIKTLLPYIEATQGQVKLPVMITGLDLIPADNDYGWNVVRRNDFTVIHDDKLKGKYNGERFSTVDEKDIPIFDKSGKFTWFAKDKGLSGLYVGRVRCIVSYGVGYLAGSGEGGRVVLFVAKPSTRKS